MSICLFDRAKTVTPSGAPTPRRRCPQAGRTRSTCASAWTRWRRRTRSPRRPSTWWAPAATATAATRCTRAMATLTGKPLRTTIGALFHDKCIYRFFCSYVWKRDGWLKKTVGRVCVMDYSNEFCVPNTSYYNYFVLQFLGKQFAARQEEPHHEEPDEGHACQLRGHPRGDVRQYAPPPPAPPALPPPPHDIQLWSR